MILNMLFSTKTVLVVSDVAIVMALLVFLYGMTKVTYEKVTKKPWPVNTVTKWLDVVVEVFNNLLGAYNKALVAMGKPAVFLPKPPSDSPPSSPPT